MKQKTRRKYWGRSAVAGSLRSAVNGLAEAIDLASQPPPASPLADKLRKVLNDINHAIEYERIYELSRKRIRQHLENERKHIEELLKEVTGVAITKDEKLAKKAKGRR